MNSTIGREINRRMDTVGSPFRDSTKFYFVDASKSSSGDGRTWEGAYKTIAEAVTAVGTTKDCTVFVRAGDYTLTATLAVPADGFALIGQGHRGIATKITCTSDIITIDKSNVEIAGIGFLQATDAKDCIVISDTTAADSIYIHDCHFNGTGGGEYGIISVDTSADSAQLVIENNVFKAFNTAAISVDSTQAIIQNNIIFGVASTTAIVVAAQASPEGFVVANNIIVGVDDGDTGIEIAQTPTKGTYAIVNNYVLGAATTITQTANNEYGTAFNYDATNAGGAQIDTVA